MRAKTGVLRPPPAGPRAVQPVPTARGWLSQHVALADANGARRLLLPFDFGEPAGDVGMLRLERAGLLKGGVRFVNLPLPQKRVPVHKGLVC